MSLIGYLIIANLFFSQTYDIEKVLEDYNNRINIQVIYDVLHNELQHNNIVLLSKSGNEIVNRNDKRDGYNLLLIPQFIISHDTINGDVDIILDSTTLINRAILFEKNNYLGSLVFTTDERPFFCPKEISAMTNFSCGKYIYREKDYIGSLKYVLKQNPIQIFKDPNFERVWFFIDELLQVYAITYESNCYRLIDFLKNKDNSRFSLPSWENNIIKK